MSPTALLLFRSASGCVALALIVLVLGKPLFRAGWRGRLVGFAIMAITNAVIPWIAIGWGEERISSGLASILNSTTTLWTALLIYWVMPTERPTLINYLGVVIGFAGVVVLVYPELAAHGISGDVLGDRKSTPELQSRRDLVCRLLLEKKKKKKKEKENIETKSTKKTNTKQEEIDTDLIE